MSQNAQPVDDEFEEQLGNLVAKLRGRDMEWARELYEEKLEVVDEKLAIDTDEEGKKKYARGLTRTEISNMINLGDLASAQVITLGYNTPLPFDDPIFRGYGIVIPDDQPAGLAQIRMDQSNASDVGLSFQELRTLFRPWKTLDVEASIRDSDTLANAYILELNNGSFVDEADDGMEKDEMDDLVGGHVDSVTLQEVGTNLSVQDDRGYPAEFGIDVKKIPEAYVVDLIVSSNSARYILQDETVVDPEELDPSVRGDDAGLTAWLGDKADVEFGAGSILDVYGVTSTTDDGEVNMNVIGLDAILPAEVDQDISSSGGNGGSSRNENVEEREI